MKVTYPRNEEEAAAWKAEIEASNARDRRNRRLGAKRFADACERGDVGAFLEAADFLYNETMGGWRLAMKRVARLSSVSPEIRAAFLVVWIESKHLALRVENRRALADALRVLMPAAPGLASMQLYRGTTWGERRRRLYGFSWTTSQETAHEFAELHSRVPGGAVVLETLAPSSAILLVREKEGYYDEGEVVVDPFRLGRVTVAERLSQALVPELARPR